MAIGTQTSIAKHFAVLTAFLVTIGGLLLLPFASAAEDAAVPAISPGCATPFADISTPVPLPSLAAALVKKQPIRVMAIGSSSTVGVGATAPSRNYPNQLSRILMQNFSGLQITVINRGVSGEAAATTAERMPMQVAIERPTLILWQVGTNDALARVPVEDFKGTVRARLQWLKSHQIDVVLVGLQYTEKSVRDEHYQAIRTALQEVASEESVLLVRRYAAMQFLEKTKGSTMLTNDDLHHNDLGYQCMAEHIAHAMVVSSFLKVHPRPLPVQ